MIRVTKVRARTLGVVGAAGMAAALLPAGPAAAVACTVNGISPTYVTVGLSPVTRTYDVNLATCASAKSWTIDIPAANITPTNLAPTQTIDQAGLANTDAGTSGSTVTTVSDDDQTATDTGPFRLLRRTTWQSGTFNASPEPVTKGKSITIKGKLVRANWDEDRYVGYAGRSVALQFKAKNTASYVHVKYVKTGSTGWVSTTVKASKDGSWRLRYGGNSIAAGSISHGDSVDVR
jgi:hypothetical protein